MKDRLVNKQLVKLKNNININQNLKRKLRSEFISERRLRWKMSASFGAVAVVCIILIAYLLLPDKFVEKVNAASLKILNQISFFDIGSGNSIDVAELNGTVYTANFGKGIYSYSINGSRRIYGKDASSISISPDGKWMAFSDGSLKTLSLSDNSVKVLLKSDDLTYYEDPSWSSDGNYLLYVKKVIAPGETHGFTVKQSDIMRYDIRTSGTEKLAEGNTPSFIAGVNAIIFEKENEIIRRELKDGAEKVIDEGRFPSVSPDGLYVAYVKTGRTVRKTAGNLTITENVDNVWIGDTNFATKKKVTGNYIRQEGNQEENNNNLGSVPVNIEKSGIYSYYNPSWSSDSESVYVIKGGDSERGDMRLMKISFTEETIGPRDTVNRFLQALITRDDDYAKSLVEDPTSVMTISNPHPVGYKIIGEGKEGDRYYVDDEVYSVYTSQPDYYITKERCYLKKTETGYIITERKLKENVSVFSRDDNTVMMKGNQGKKTLFGKNDIPKEYLPKGGYRLSSLVYDQASDSVIFTVQALQDAGQKASVRIIRYGIKDKAFQLIDHIEKVGGKENVGVEDMIPDPLGNYLSVDLFSDNDPSYRPYVFIYSLKDNRRVKTDSLFEDTSSKSIHTKFWNENGLILDVNYEGQTMSYVYDPGKNQLFGY